MNSLTYLSRQFDVLASARTPPSTPTSEKQHLLSLDGSDREGDAIPRLKRTQTWNKSFAQGRPSSKEDEGQPAKRSFSLPSFGPLRSPSKVHIVQVPPPTTPEQKKPQLPQRIRRLYLVRAFVVLWNTLCETWRYFVQNSIIRARTRSIAVGDVGRDKESVGSLGEKPEDSDEDFDPIVARAKPKPELDLEISSASTSSTILQPEENIISPISIELSPSTITTTVLALSTRPKSSKLLPNPFASTVLTQTSRSSSPSPSISLPSTPPPHPHLRKTPFHLPKTLVLDLDETLIHSTSRPMTGHGTGGTGLLGLGGRRNKGAGHMVEVILNGRSTLYHVYKRPFVDYFLRKVRSWSFSISRLFSRWTGIGLVYPCNLYGFDAGIRRPRN